MEEEREREREREERRKNIMSAAKSKNSLIRAKIGYQETKKKAGVLMRERTSNEKEVLKSTTYIIMIFFIYIYLYTYIEIRMKPFNKD